MQEIFSRAFHCKILLQCQSAFHCKRFSVSIDTHLCCETRANVMSFFDENEPPTKEDIMDFFKKRSTPMTSADPTFYADIGFWKQVSGDAGSQRLLDLAKETQPSETQD